MRRVLAMVMVLIMMSAVTVYAEDTEISVGDYVTLGSYDGEDLKWQVIHINDDGSAMLFCDRIVDRMAFDAAESGTDGLGTGKWAYGSNRFYNSNIREWLNSDEETVVYSTTKPLLDALQYLEDFEGTVLSGLTEEAPGFLYGFTDAEEAALVDWKYLVDTKQTFSIGELPESFGSVYIETMSSKVFLLSLEEYTTYVDGQGLNGFKKDSTGERDYYWLRTPDGAIDVQVATIDDDGYVFKTTANYSYTGIVPATVVDLSNYPILSGNGKVSSPFTLDFTYAQDMSVLLTADEVSAIRNAVQGYLASLEANDTPQERERVARAIESTIISSDDAYAHLAGYDQVMEEVDMELDRHLYVKPHLLTGTYGPDIAFSDTDGLSIEAQGAIDGLASLGIINGYEDGTFRPDRTISRAETAKVMTLLTQTFAKSYSKNFSDVEGYHWHHSYVESAKRRGYINGYGDGSFRPDESVTFDEFSGMIARVLENDFGFYDAAPLTDSGTVQGSDVAGWAVPYVTQLIEKEILANDEIYSGSRKVTRVEVTLLLNRLKEYIYE